MSTNGHDPDRETSTDERTERSVRPGSSHDLENGAVSVHEDPDDPATAAGYLLQILRKVGRIDIEAEAARDHRAEMQRAIDANSRSNRSVQTALEAQGRTLEGFATEMRGTLAGLARTHESLAKDLAPVLAARSHWGVLQTFAAKIGITLASLSALIGGGLKIYETLKGH